MDLDATNIKLTDLASCGGCAAKYSAARLEQMLAGFVPAEAEYLRFVREATEREGVLLIFDEVMTFRLDTGGAQALYDIRPDLTAFAKIIGGG